MNQNSHIKSLLTEYDAKNIYLKQIQKEIGC